MPRTAARMASTKEVFLVCALIVFVSLLLAGPCSSRFEGVLTSFFESLGAEVAEEPLTEATSPDGRYTATLWERRHGLLGVRPQIWLTVKDHEEGRRAEPISMLAYQGCCMRARLRWTQPSELSIEIVQLAKELIARREDDEQLTLSVVILDPRPLELRVPQDFEGPVVVTFADPDGESAGIDTTARVTTRRMDTMAVGRLLEERSAFGQFAYRSIRNEGPDAYLYPTASAHPDELQILDVREGERNGKPYVAFSVGKRAGSVEERSAALERALGTF